MLKVKDKKTGAHFEIRPFNGEEEKPGIALCDFGVQFVCACTDSLKDTVLLGCLTDSMALRVDDLWIREQEKESRPAYLPNELEHYEIKLATRLRAAGLDVSRIPDKSETDSTERGAKY